MFSCSTYTADTPVVAMVSTLLPNSDILSQLLLPALRHIQPRDHENTTSSKAHKLVAQVREGEIATPSKKGELHRSRARLFINLTSSCSSKMKELLVVESIDKVGKDATSFSVEPGHRCYSGYEVSIEVIGGNHLGLILSSDEWDGCCTCNKNLKKSEHRGEHGDGDVLEVCCAVCRGRENGCSVK